MTRREISVFEKTMIRPPLGLCLLLLSLAFSPNQAFAASEPNFLVIVADDMGWSDPGFLGSKIQTPNIDRLAAGGTFFSNFYVAPTCSPTRSMLLTGVSNHKAGVGTMHGLQAPNQMGHVEYGAQLHGGVITIAEMLRAKGYATSMSGKWHLAVDAEQYPKRRGFEQSFGLLQGGASHFSDGRKIHRTENVRYLEGGKPTKLPSDFYSTYAYTDKIIDYINTAKNRPFFAYLAYTAPHDPLQVPDDWLDKYDGVFDSGPAFSKKQRVDQLVEMGLIEKDVSLAQPPNIPSWLDAYKKPWDERSAKDRKTDARRMEIYAAMVEIMDSQIGRVIEHLRQIGKLDNTYIIFMSDNGASVGTPYTYPANNRAWVDQNYDLSPAQMGKVGSFTTMGREWTNNSNTPFRFFKATVGEGGVRSPFIISGPGILPGTIQKKPAHVMDIVPTIYELADILPANQDLYDGKAMPTGQSFMPFLTTAASNDDRMIVTELFGSRMVRKDKWKAAYINPPAGSGEWELFDISIDPSATNNLAAENPELLLEMRKAYDDFAIRNNVIVPDPPMTPKLISLFEGRCDRWCQAKFIFAETMIDKRKRMVSLALLLGLLTFLGFIFG